MDEDDIEDEFDEDDEDDDDLSEDHDDEDESEEDDVSPTRAGSIYSANLANNDQDDASKPKQEAAECKQS